MAFIKSAIATAITILSLSLSQAVMAQNAGGGSMSGNRLNLTSQLVNIDQQQLNAEQIFGKGSFGVGPVKVDGKYQSSTTGGVPVIESANVSVGSGASMSGTEINASSTMANIRQKGGLIVASTTKVGGPEMPR